MKIVLKYGNECEELITDQQNKFKWTLFFEIEDYPIKNFIDKIGYDLHPSFQNPHRSI